MFTIEKQNRKIGAYLRRLIEKRYPSHRQFCREYLIAAGLEPNDEELRKMGNRVSQIISGAKAIQTYDLPLFTELLGVSCEAILSCGKTFVPIGGHITNYEIAFSDDPKKWKKYVERSDRLILNADEYNKTVIDYAIEFKNYPFLRYLIDEGYVWFVDGNVMGKYDCTNGFGAGTKITRRGVGSLDSDLPIELNYHSEEKGLRQSLIALALENRDFDELGTFRARETPALYQLCMYPPNAGIHGHAYYDDDVIEAVSDACDEVLAYFSEDFTITDNKGRENTFIYPFLSELIDRLLVKKNRGAEAVIRRAVEHNKEVERSLRALLNEAAQIVRAGVSGWYVPDEQIVKKEAMRYYDFNEEDGFVSFLFPKAKREYSCLYSNLVRANETSDIPAVQALLDELNLTFEKVRTICPDPPEQSGNEERNGGKAE